MPPYTYHYNFRLAIYDKPLGHYNAVVPTNTYTRGRRARLIKISMISTKLVHFKGKKKNGAKMFGMISVTTHKNAPRIAFEELQL